MKKNRARILLGIVILIGLIAIFFANVSTNKEVPQNAQAAKKEKNLKLADDESFAVKLDELREISEKIDKGNLELFKSQVQVGFNKLANLIDEVPGLSVEATEGVKEEIAKIKESAEKIAASEEEGIILNEIKKGFDTSKKALEEVKDGLYIKEEKRAEMCKCVDKHIDKMESIIDMMNLRNYRQATKELFRVCYLTLKCMKEKRGMMEVMNSVQVIEQQINKPDKEEVYEKEKEKCDCEDDSECDEEDNENHENKHEKSKD